VGRLLHSDRVRSPAVAGAAYPDDPRELTRTVDGLLSRAQAGPRQRVRGIIAPHADYALSGPTAAEAFMAAKGGAFRRAVVIGPSHHMRFEGLAAPSHSAFATPVGNLPVDAEAVAELVAANLARIDDGPHGPEHAIEVELPFLRVVLGAVPIIPLLSGDDDAMPAAGAIARLWTADTLLVVSTDLSHFEPYASARRHDARTAAAIEAFDEAAIGLYDACGYLAVRGALIVASRLGLHMERLDLRNSGDAAGDKDRVVGYGAWVIGAPPGDAS
jgi:MEMO1 family protein